MKLTKAGYFNRWTSAIIILTLSSLPNTLGQDGSLEINVNQTQELLGFHKFQIDINGGVHHFNYTSCVRPHTFRCRNESLGVINIAVNNFAEFCMGPSQCRAEGEGGEGRFAGFTADMNVSVSVRGEWLNVSVKCRHESGQLHRNGTLAAESVFIIGRSAALRSNYSRFFCRRPTTTISTTTNGQTTNSTKLESATPKYQAINDTEIMKKESETMPGNSWLIITITSAIVPSVAVIIAVVIIVVIVMLKRKRKLAGGETSAILSNPPAENRMAAREYTQEPSCSEDVDEEPYETVIPSEGIELIGLKGKQDFGAGSELVYQNVPETLSGNAETIVEPESLYEQSTTSIYQNVNPEHVYD